MSYTLSDGSVWNYRQKITVNSDGISLAANVVGPHNFHFDNASRFAHFWAHVSSTKGYLAVTSSGGSTVLSSAIKTWDYAGQSVYFDVRHTWSSSADTVIYIHYGYVSGGSYPRTDASAFAVNTYSDFVGAYSMADGADTSHITDLSGNSRTGTKGGAGAPAESTGKAGKGQTFVAASSQKIDCTTSWPTFTNLTTSFWYKATSFPTSGNLHNLLGNYDNTTSFAGGFEIDFHNNAGTQNLRFVYTSADGLTVPVSTYTHGFATGAWHHVAIVHNAATDTDIIYVDGVAVVTDTSRTMDIINAGSPKQMGLGYLSVLNSRFADGVMDEVKIGSSARTASDIKLDYVSVNSQDDWGTVGTNYLQADAAEPSTTVALGQATEIDSAQPVGPHVVALGQAAETDSALALQGSWSYRAPVTVSSLNWNTLTYQVALDLSTLPALFAAALSSGDDIRVRDASNADLPFYLASYDAVAHTGTLWVKLTGLTTPGATIYVLAGNPIATPASSFSSTFQKLTADSKTQLLWHFDDASGTNADDASANNLDGTITGASWVGSDGGAWNGTTTTFATGDCLSFAAGDKVANTSYVLPARGTFEAWLRPDWASTTAVHKQIALLGDASSYRYLYFNKDDDSFRVDDLSGTVVQSSPQAFAANAWLHLAIVWYDTPYKVRRIYVNGVNVTSSNDTTKTMAANNGFSFAFSSVRGEAGFSGRADEVRLSNYPRTAEEINASYQRRAPLPANTVLTKNGSNPTVPTGVTWEGNNTDEPAVLYESGTYKMWYRGGDPFSGPNWSGIGYATSADGETWTKYASNPVIAGASGAAYWTPYVFKNGSTYYLYATKQTSATPGSGSTIVRATSSDGITWTAPATVLSLSGSEQNFGNKTVWIEGSTWYMLYEWQNASSNWVLSLATSTDGVTWTKSASNPVLQIASGAGTVGGPEVRKIGNYYYLLAQVAPSGNTPTDIYLYRSSNLTSWTELGTNPVLWRSKTWETNQVADASLVDDPSGTTLHLYFDGVNGAVEQTGSATTPFTVNQFLTAAEAPTAGPAHTIVVGQVIETDLAQPVGQSPPPAGTTPWRSASRTLLPGEPGITTRSKHGRVYPL